MSVHTLTKPCSYCEGHGYVQLLLGGSETCPYCKGTASEKEQK
ncbi:YuiA family protein [Bacillus thermotolerans]|nr:YuiA family protein [Bacillus thermotolerans]